MFLFCLRRSRHLVFSCLRRSRCSGFSLASAICFWFASVAPVRGGTYFLCRRKESKQRKRAHTASACCYPRAPDGPILRTATRDAPLVANARLGAPPTHAPVYEPATSVVCRPLAANGMSVAVPYRVLPEPADPCRRCPMRRSGLHTVCRKGAAERLMW